METTHTMAGQLAVAGAARLRAAAPVASCSTGAALAVSYGVVEHQVTGSHQLATWTTGAIAQPATSMVFDRKNRPSRPLSELSP